MDDLRTELTIALNELALAVLLARGLQEDLERLARLSTRLIEQCSGASFSMLVDGEPTTIGVTDRVALELDILQYDAAEGPCMMALGGGVVRVGFVAGDQRFPHFASGAADRRVHSVLSTPVIDHGRILGTLNMYSHDEDAFGDAEQDVAYILAAEAAAAIAVSSLHDEAHRIRLDLQMLHDEAARVSLAQGVVMGIHECNATQAMHLLHNAAGTTGDRLLTVAERILSAVQDEPSRGADPTRPE